MAVVIPDEICFNSLFEMLENAAASPANASEYIVSILYLRCAFRRSQIRLGVLDVVSILYLRCDLGGGAGTRLQPGQGFNSLFEMPPPDGSSQAYQLMQRFNSLFEMQLDAVPLLSLLFPRLVSILYLRCTAL